MAKINYVEWLKEFEHFPKNLVEQLPAEAYSWEELFRGTASKIGLLQALPSQIVSAWDARKIVQWYTVRVERIADAYMRVPLENVSNQQMRRLMDNLGRQLVKRILAALKAPGKADTDAEWRIRYLRKIAPVGTEVTPVVTSVAPSGMSRRMRVFVPVMEEAADGTKRMRIQEITRLVCFVTGERWNDKHEQLSISNAGMDMCFEVVYRLSIALYGDGYALQYGRV